MGVFAASFLQIGRDDKAAPFRSFRPFTSLPRPQATPNEPTVKPHGVSDAETRHWLKEFGDLADDPNLKELFDPYEFLEGESTD